MKITPKALHRRTTVHTTGHHRRPRPSPAAVRYSCKMLFADRELAAFKDRCRQTGMPAARILHRLASDWAAGILILTL